MVKCPQVAHLVGKMKGKKMTLIGSPYETSFGRPEKYWGNNIILGTEIPLSRLKAGCSRDGR